MTRFREVRLFGDWRLKLYSIVYGDGEIDWPAYNDVWALLAETLPTPAVTEQRPGVGFVIAHQGNSVHYLVTGWWDRQNELPFRIWVRGFDPGDRWRTAEGAESVCVWDLAVIWYERGAYVETMLAAGAPGTDAYLARRYEQ